MPGFDRVNVAGNYLAGRAAAQDEKYADTRNVLAEQSVSRNEQVMQKDQDALSAEQRKQFATKMVQAAQYGIQSTAPKQFIEQNYPELAQLAGPSWQTATDDDVRNNLQDAIGKFGPEAGIGPAIAAPEEFGTTVQEVVRDGKPVAGVIGKRGTFKPIEGAAPYVKPSVAQPNQPNVPSGYRFTKDGNLEPIPGGPADPKTPNTKDDSRIFAKADKLRDEFNAQSKEFITVNDSYNTVKTVASDHSAAGDLSMIFAFMKMLDPNSVVREQEFANAQNAAGVPQRVANTYNKLLSGERLSESQRKDFINQANNLYKSKKSRQDAIVKRYTEIAKRNKVNPDDVVGDLSVVVGEGQAASDSSAGGWSITPVPYCHSTTSHHPTAASSA